MNWSVSHVVAPKNRRTQSHSRARSRSTSPTTRGSSVTGASMNASQTIRVVRRELSVHTGPLPPPEVLARYEQIMPGAVELLFRNFERQSQHRMEIEKI